MHNRRNLSQRFYATISALVACTFLAPILAGCGRSADTGSAGSMVRSEPQTYGTVPAPQNAPQQKPGMSNGKKLAILAGTAALIYLYNKHKNAKGTGEQGQYYRSRNGRIYYRDAKGNAVYVTPPAAGIQVPADVAERYNRAAQTGNYDVDEGAMSNNYGGTYGTAPAYGGTSGGTMVPPGPRQ